MNVRALAVGILGVLLASQVDAAQKLGPQLADVLQSGGRAGADTMLVWVYFSDKGREGLAKSIDPGTVVSERSLQRRRNVLPADALVDESDLPVAARYIDMVSTTGVRIQHRSRWFNAVSASASAGQIAQIAALPFVREVELTGRYRRRTLPDMENADPPLTRLAKTLGPDALDYGPSVNQVTQINVPPIHAMGNSAQGVIIGVFDNGFRLPNHEAFASMQILATYDFVDHKVSVVPNNPSTSFGDHGVNTLSTIGGYQPGKLIGPAYGASYLLARTENDSSETPLEEDTWVAAIEWADSIGVQVTSTSLGYLDYDFPYTSWTWEDMDGRTTVITRAAAMAVRKGILVVNSAGNAGSNMLHNTLDAPADADSVVAAGAVGLDGKRVSFSSVGPTTATPPHTKPDLMALGVSVYVASETNPSGYYYQQGTSFSCPLVAGVAALLIKSHPTAPPMEIVAAMKLTASSASTPDNFMGWGIANALSALNHLSGTDTGGGTTVPDAYALDQNFPNPFNPRTTITYDLPVPGFVTLTVFDMLGRTITTLVDGEQPQGRRRVLWNGTTGEGRPVASGAYLYRLVARGRDGSSTVQSKRMVLLR